MDPSHRTLPTQPLDRLATTSSLPRRLALIGCGGAGKTTVARRMGEILDLPVYHLDSLFWKPGWVPAEPAAWAQSQAELCLGDTWILDGNYGGTLDLRLAAADTILFFDLPRHVCLWRVMKRSVQHLGRTRPEMPSGCVERVNRDYLAFLLWIWSYRRTRRPGILEKLVRFGAAKTVVMFRTDLEISGYLEQLSTLARSRRDPGASALD